MATEREIREIARPIVESRNDVFYWRRKIIFTPINHVFRCCHFNGSAEKGAFHLEWGFHRLGNGGRLGGFAYGNELMRPSGSPPGWNVSRSDCAEQVQDVFERIIVPKLAPFDSFENILAHHRSQIDGAHSLGWEIAHCLLCLGRYEEARDALRERLSLSGYWLGQKLPIDLDRLCANRRKLGWQVAWDGFIGLAKSIADMGRFQKLARENPRQLLDEIESAEARVITEAKLEKHWRPTPLPEAR